MSGDKASGNKAAIWIVVVLGGCGCLLIGTAIAGIVAAIVIPNFVDAVEKAKQKRTVADIRFVGTTWMAYATDHFDDGAADLPVGDLPFERLEALLVPEYAVELPTTDGWGHPLAFRIVSSGTSGLAALEIQSPGRDGVLEPPPAGDSPFPAISYDRDIVWRDGQFVAYPASGF